MTSSSTFRIQKDLKEIAEMSWEDAAPIMATPTSDHLANLTALVVGPPGTCYHGGFITFSVKPTPLYPNEPPVVRCLSTSEGKLRLNPNLYADGKVCLSMLGTYRGETSESWRSSYSLRYILQCIQSMVLNEEPYHNEPGFNKSTWHRGVQLLLPANHPGALTPGIVDMGVEPERSLRAMPGGGGGGKLPANAPPPPTAEELLEMQLATQGNPPQESGAPSAHETHADVGDQEEKKKKRDLEVAEEKSAKAEKEKVKREVRRYLVSSNIIQQQAHSYHEKITHESIRISVCDVLECLLPNCKAPEYMSPQNEEGIESAGAVATQPVFLATPKAQLPEEYGGGDGGDRDSNKTPEFESPLTTTATELLGATDDGGSPVMGSTSVSAMGVGHEDDDVGGEIALGELLSTSATPQASTPVTTNYLSPSQAGFTQMQPSGTPPLVADGSPQMGGSISPPPPFFSSSSHHQEKSSSGGGGASPVPGKPSPTTSPSVNSGGYKVTAPSSLPLTRKNFLECSRVELFSAEIKRQFLIRYDSYVEVCNREARLAEDGTPFAKVMFEFPANQAAGIFTWKWLLSRLENIKRHLQLETDAWLMKGRELTAKHAYAAEDLAGEASRIADNVPSASGSLVSPDNSYHWSLGFFAPEGLYEEGFYNVDVVFCPAQDQPPRCRFVQPIYHPNISPEGHSVYFLWDDRAIGATKNSNGGENGGDKSGNSTWTPTKVARGLLQLLTSKPLQYPAVVLNPEAAKQCFSSDETDVKEFRKKARRMARNTVE